MKTGILLGIIATVCLSGGVTAPAQTNSLTEQILRMQAFPEGLVWTGGKEPSVADNTDVLAVLNHMQDASWTTAIETFLQQHPQSPWAASLRHDYASFCRESGRTTKALQQWEAAWALVKNDTSPVGQKLAGSILANWIDQLASLGRLDKMQELVATGDGMHFASNADRDKFQGAKNSFYLMQSHPGIAYRCGTFALKAVGKTLHPEDKSLENLAELSSPTNGFSMATLLDLAKQYGLKMTAVRRMAGQDLIVPCVVHWRQNHYAAILARQDDSYLVNDPTFGHERWLTADVINEEAGGEFLVPATAITTNLTLLAKNELEAIHGRGLPNNVNDAKDKGCQPGQPCPPCGGMPVAWVSEPYINLWLADEPMSYLTASGEPFTFRVTYKQRDTRPNSLLGGSYAQVTGWNHNWFSSIHLAGSIACLGSPQPTCDVSLGTSYATVYLPGGGTVTFNPGQNYDPETRLKLLQQNPSITLQGGGTDEGTHGLRLVHADGSQDLYVNGFLNSASAGHLPSADFVRTRHVDVHGRTTWFYYTTTNLIKVLSTVVDPDGRTNLLKYIFPAGQQVLLAEVDNPYGLKVYFQYDASGNLTNITDAQNLSSRITYDTNNYPTALITPYGTNRFAINMNNILATGGAQGNFGGHDLVDRAVQISDPIGATSLWLYRYDCSAGTNLVMSTSFPANEVPTNTPLGTLDDGTTGGTNAGVCFRNSFYWGPRQYAALSSGNFSNFTASDYVRGRMRHWLADGDDLNLSGQVSVERAPSPDGTAEGLKLFYDYQGKLFPHRTGTNALPSVTAWRLPGGETHYDWSRYDFFGNVTNLVSTGTLPDGTLGTRTNQFVYSTNIYSYNYSVVSGGGSTTTNWIVPNLLTKVIAADGIPIWSAGGFERVTVTNYYPSGSQTNQIITGWSRVLPNTVTNAIGQTASFIFSGFDQLTSCKSISGLTTTNLYSNPTNGFLLQTIDLEIGRTNSFSFTSNGLVGTFTNELGLNVALGWDNLLRPISVQFPDGTYVSNRFDKLDLAGRRDRMGNWTSFAHDNARHLTATTNANNAATIYDWCGCGALNSVLDALTNLTTINHDSAGRETGYNFPDNSSVAYQLDLAGRTTNVTDGAGRNVQFTLNHQGLPTVIKDAYGHILQRTAYDLRDRPIVVTDANGVSVTNIFDALNRPLARIWHDGIGEGYGYNERGLAFYTNRNGQVTRYGRDVAGRPTAVTNANLEVVSASYNPADEILTLLDGLNHQTSWQYNPYGWVTNKTDGLGRNAFRYLYNPNGWLTNRWTPEKGNTGYGLDNVGNVLTVSYPLSSITYAYDKLNRWTNMVDAVGTTTRSYTPANRVATENGPWASDTVSYAFEQGLRTNLTLQTPNSNIVTAYNFDLVGRMTNLVSTMAGGFIYQFLDPRPGLPAAIYLPNGATITNTFDSLTRLKMTALKDHWGHTLDGYTYGVDVLGLKTNILRDLGLTTSAVKVGYDGINQLTAWTATESNGTPRMNEQEGFAFDAANNLLRRTNNLLVQTYVTDNANQLTTLSRAGTLTLAGATPAPANTLTVNGQAAQTYGDFTFARTNLALLNGSNSFTNIAANVYGVLATNITSSFLPASISVGYDSNGNLTNDGVRSMSYDSENQLTNVTLVGIVKKDFIYDGLNRLRIKREYGWIGGTWNKTNEIRFVWDGNSIVQLRDSNNVPTLTLTRGLDLSGSLQGAGGIGGILAMTEGNGVNSYFHNDASGNVTALMDGSEQIVGRRMYDAFGKTIRLTGGKTGANPFGFSSQLQDDTTGFVHYQRRVYLPGFGRFANADPIQEAGGVNLYGFVDNNPLSNIDLFGLDPSMSELFWLNVYDHGLSDAGRYFSRLKDSAINTASGMFHTGTQLALNPVGLAYSQYQGVANAASALGSLSADPCAQMRAMNSLKQYAGSPEASADAVFFIESMLAGGAFATEAKVAGSGAKATGAFNPAFSGGGNGLGSLAAKEIRISQRGLDLIESHLTQFGPVEENTMMLDRLRSALANSQKLSGGDASFYLHEASEATMMGRGLSYDTAHAGALQKYGVSPFSVYSPQVIQALPGSFNRNWFSFWGLSQ